MTLLKRAERRRAVGLSQRRRNADEVHQIETIWEARCFTRRQGEPLHPDREPLDTLDRIRRTIGEYNFAPVSAIPAPLGGGLVKAEWFKRYRENERSECFDRIVQSWDTANKATELSDFSVCTTWGVKGMDQGAALHDAPRQRAPGRRRPSLLAFRRFARKSPIQVRIHLPPAASPLRRVSAAEECV